ncbi:MAG: AraC family transcriptional regulator [Bacteroidales bacterium]|nr:AraC family transcriptional regulator [Bacteroidales bacterium]
MTSIHLKYLAINPVDLEWGLAVNSVGRQEIAPGSPYPPATHPTRYLFSPQKGRVLNEYQLLYITSGRGTFSCDTLGRDKLLHVNSGSMIMLFPGEWHNYRPDPETGWTEYWIGFKGPQADGLVEKGFFSKNRPVLEVSFHDDIADAYSRAINIAEEQKSGFQQALSGIVNSLLGMAYYYNRNLSFKQSNTERMIAKAKMLVAEQLFTIDPKSLAEQLFVSYSSFRRTFKEYTGFSPAKYILNQKIDQAKEMLTNSPAEIKEIAYRLGFENTDYFFTVFRRITGQTPLIYRSETQGRKL